MRKRGYQPSRTMRVLHGSNESLDEGVAFGTPLQQAYGAMLFRKMADVNSAHDSSPVE